MAQARGLITGRRLVDSPNSMAGGGLATVLTENRARLVRFLTARTGSAAEAEDVVQEMWLHIGDRATGPIASPLSYLYRVGMNIVLGRVRSGRRRERRDSDYFDATTTQVEKEPVDDSPSAFDVLATHERVARLAAVLAGPPPGAMRVFRLHRIDGQTHADIAADLGITRSAVEKHMAVALRHIRKAFDDIPQG